MTHMQIKQQHSGFSMVETVIVVAIMAILAGLATPAFVQFLDTKTAQEEENTMRKIHEALEVFATTYGRLPHDDGDSPATNNSFCGFAPNTWAECLSLVSDLSPNEIRTDAWGRERAYSMLRDASGSAAYIGATINRHYAAVLSRGIDQMAEVQTGVPVVEDNGLDIYAAPDQGGWWNRSGTTAQKLAQYKNLEVLGDDFLVRYSDVDLKRQQYNVTLERINSIKEALKAYSAARYNLAVSSGTESGDPNKKTYYPRSRSTTGGGVTADSWANYGDQIRTDMPASQFSLYGINDQMVANDIGAANEQRRLEEMIVTTCSTLDLCS